MDIRYEKESRLFIIETDNTSYCMGIVDEEGFLSHLYYGDKIAQEDATYLLKTIEPQFVPSTNQRDKSAFMDRFPFEYSSNNVGDYRKNSIDITDKDGHSAVLFTIKYLV